MHPCVHSSIIYNNQDLETAQLPIRRREDKKAVVHLHNEILCSHKNEGNLTFVTMWMDLEIIMQS